ncbi:MAG TPA: STAS domain-containing protein [Gammaproteobacteria bacterium]|nr:STAS domain-containing protein [Gammaproteobacteria bacterium]
MAKAKKCSNGVKATVGKKIVKRLPQATIICCDSLDISGVGELHQQLNKALDDGQAVTLDASQVQRADTAALQLLAAFCQTARNRGVTVTWRQPSEVFELSACLLGLDGMLGNMA